MREFSLDDIATVRELAVAGCSLDEVSLAVKRAKADIRELLSLLGIELGEARQLEWCIKCASPRTSLDKRTGFCPICTIRARNERKRFEAEDEERRLQEAAEREADKYDQRRKRMREEYNANPHMGREKGAEGLTEGEPPSA